MTGSKLLAGALDTLVAACLHLDEPCPDPAELAERLHFLDAIRAQATEARHLVNDQMQDGPNTEAVGSWRIERRPGTRRTEWDRDGLTSEVARLSLFDPGTGARLNDSPARRRLLELLTAVARFEFRAGPLRELGIDPDEFCATDRGPRRVSVYPTTDTEETGQ